LTVDRQPASLEAFPFKERSDFMPVDVNIRKGESVERALRRLKKRLDREGVIRDARAKRYFEKPSEVRRRKKKVAAFSNMLRVRNENR
jgi:small subunit ribosomal protein S21